MATNTPLNAPQQTLPAGNPALADLRDIVQPDQVAQYWLAPGWILVVLIAVILLISGWWFWRLRRQRNAYRRIAVAELDQWLAQQKTSEPVTAEQLTFLASLLKRVALCSQPRAQVSAAYGDQWRHQLSSLGAAYLKPETTELLTEGLYRAKIQSKLGVSEISGQCRQWILKHKPVKTTEPSHAAV